MLSSLSNKIIVDGLFCDLQKAFDCVNYDILLSKMEFYCISGVANKLMESYLRNRYHRVVINAHNNSNGHFSKWEEIQHGKDYGIDSITRSHPDNSTGHAHKLTISTYCTKKSTNTSAELNLVKAQSTACAPPEDGRISGPKHVGVTFTKMFFNSFLVF